MAPELVEVEGERPSLSDKRRQLDGMKCDVYSAGIMFAEIAQPTDVLYEVRKELYIFPFLTVLSFVST